MCFFIVVCSVLYSQKFMKNIISKRECGYAYFQELIPLLVIRHRALEGSVRCVLISSTRVVNK